MKEIETATFQHGLSPEELMRSAAEAVVQNVQRLGSGGVVLVLAGPGKNGGDGVVAADMLERQGVPTVVYSVRRAGTEPFDGRVIRREDDADGSRLAREVRGAATIVDALLGIGQNRPPDEQISAILTEVQAAALPDSVRLAVDIPTGVNPDTGAVPGAVFSATETVSMGFPKLGLVTQPGAGHTGRLNVVDIGIPAELARDVHTFVPEASDIARMLPSRAAGANKGSSGRLEVISGSRDFSGAPVLCSMSAYRVGAGLVEIATPRSAHAIVAAHVIEPVFRALPDEGGMVCEASLPAVRAGLGKAQACVVGPGLGLSATIVGFIHGLLRVLEAGGVPTLIDADGLNALSKLPRWWEIENTLVLTPHPGEMSRLSGLSVSEIQSDRLHVARHHASLWNKVVVLKGAGTVIAAPDGEAAINPTGGPNLGTAGTGDVLSGIIGGLLAQGMSPFDAAVCGVYLHGRAGDLLRADWGDVGTIAGDLIDILPRARLSIFDEKRALT